VPNLESLGGTLALLCAVAAVVRRKHAIGGWLFYFICQVVLGLTLVAAGTHWRYYSTREWSDPLRYFLFTLSNLSRVVLLAAIGVVFVLLAETRDRQWVGGLQYALATYAFLTVVKLPVDMYCFPSSVNRDALSLAFPVVWMAYFALSARVRKVFLEKSWG
jgi:hypothetical protein